MFELSSYSLIVFAHVASAMTLVGHSLGSPLVHAMIRDARSLPALRAWLDFARQSARWNPAAALVLLGSGVYLGSAGWWSQAWFHVAVAAWVVNLLLAALVVKRSAAALGMAAARAGDGPVPDDVDRLRRLPGWAAAARTMLANDLAILYVMIGKPSLVESLAVMAMANAVLLGLSLVRTRIGAANVSPWAVPDRDALQRPAR